MNLTARSYLLAGLILTLGIVGQWGAEDFRGWWRPPAALWVLALAVEGFRARRIRLDFHRRLPARAYLGRRFDGVLALHNPGASAVRVEFMEDLPDGLQGEAKRHHLRIEPGETVSCPTPFAALELGEVTWQDIFTRRRGVFGLAWWPRKVRVPARLDVVPDRLHGSERRRPSTEQAGASLARLRGEGAELMGLRPYRPGDPLRAIDWKATARSGEPIARLFSDEQNTSLIILLDVGLGSGLRYGSLTRLGHYINVAARLGERAIARRQPVSLVTFADRVVSCEWNLKGTQGAGRLRLLLDSTRTVPLTSNPLAGALAVRRTPTRRSLVVMLSDVDESAASAQLLKAVNLLQPKHLPLTVGMVDDEVAAMREQAADDWLDPYQNLAAQETLALWEATRTRLTGMGVPVVLAPPNRLDKAVLDYYERLLARRRV